MLRKTFLLSIAQLLALSTAVSIPSPVVGDPEAEADRAEVAGIMKSKTGRSSHYYLFVTNEYSGDQLLRQSTCDIHAKSRKELWEGAQCQDLWQLPKFEGELTFNELRRIKHYRNTNRFEHGEGSPDALGEISDDEMRAMADDTLRIKTSRVRASNKFEFSVLSDPEKRIASRMIKVQAGHWTCEEDNLTGDEDCLWTPPPGTNKQIAPYSWFSEASSSAFDFSNGRISSGSGKPYTDDYERVQQEFEGLRSTQEGDD